MSSTHPWVILLDIDGTLLTVDRNFNRPLLRSIVNELGIDYEHVETDPFSGRTDHDILTSFLVNHEEDEELYLRFKSRYLERMENEMTAEHLVRHDHVDEAIEYFSSGDFIIGLLTGNYPGAAELKLNIADIQVDYKFGAFGEHHKDRNMLPQLALNAVEELTGTTPDPQKFVIVGDTPRDVICAKHAGMKCVSVLTGKFSEEELQKYNPDLIIDTLKNPDYWFKKVAGNAA